MALSLCLLTATQKQITETIAEYKENIEKLQGQLKDITIKLGMETKGLIE
ncbi:10211_t:CDS:2 [Ambispora gerdemannii]|uniref:10211_t:CDS:1 n=1 Tax=Ambispora gerdemannii TaxID=144530 RepID=A0A9N9AH74_9GLOM|nr:10211_t:CDS:2 [Ambispora gerdemannii]